MSAFFYHAVFTILFLFISVSFVYSYERTNEVGTADKSVGTVPVQGVTHTPKALVPGFTNGALNAYEEIMRVIRDGFKQIREGKKEITLYLDLDDNPKTKEKIAISLKNFYQLEDLIKKQVDQSVKEIQKNLTDSPAPPKASGNSL